MSGDGKKRVNWKRQALAAERLRFEIVRNGQSRHDPLRMDLLALGVAHEFNNILGAALGHADWALESLDPKDMKDALEVIRVACLRCAQITKSLQGVTQPREEGKSIFLLSNLFDELTRLWLNRADKSGILIRVEVTNIRAYLEASSFLEIFSNLIKNSFEVLEQLKVPNPEVNIKVRVEGEMAIVTFQDNGPGIPKTHQPYVFQPFFSTKGSIRSVYESSEEDKDGEQSTNPKNSGLGLFLSRALAQEMGGDLQLIDSTSGTGVHFELSLPIIQ